jgi:hypothetical protein
VAFEFRVARRRSIGFSVGLEGLSVRAPRWVRRADVDEALHERAHWILDKLAEQRERAQRLEAARVQWREGASIPFLGEPVVLVVDPRVAGAALDAESQGLPGLPRRVLRVGLPHDVSAAQLREAVQGWLQRQALRVSAGAATRAATGCGCAGCRSARRPRAGAAQCRRRDRLHWRDPLHAAGDDWWWHTSSPPARDESQPCILGRGAIGRSDYQRARRRR